MTKAVAMDDTGQERHCKTVTVHPKLDQLPNLDQNRKLSNYTLDSKTRTYRKVRDGTEPYEENRWGTDIGKQLLLLLLAPNMKTKKKKKTGKTYPNTKSVSNGK